MNDETKKNGAVNHSAHYTFGSIEVADALEDWQMNLWRGTVIKYIVRAGRKRKETEIEDLQKAAWYLNREIERMQKTTSNSDGELYYCNVCLTSARRYMGSAAEFAHSKCPNSKWIKVNV